MHKFVVITSNAEERALSAYLFKQYICLDIAGWLRSEKVRPDGLDGRSWIGLCCSLPFVSDKVADYVQQFLNSHELVDGLVEQITRISQSGLYDDDSIESSIRRLVSHVSKQTAAMWANFSLIFQYDNVVASTDDCAQFCLTAFIWAMCLGAEKVFKFVIQDAYSRWAGEERPKAPPSLRTGALFAMFAELRVPLKKRSHPVFQDGTRRWHFIHSVLQAKKGTHAIPKWDIDKGLLDTFEELTTEATYVAPEKNAIDAMELLKVSIYDVIQEVFNPRVVIKARPLVPSLSAAEGFSRREGGGLTGVSLATRWASYVNGILENDVPLTPEEIEGVLVNIVDIPQDLLRNLWEDQRDPHPVATVRVVLESFKLRPITTGPSVDYYLAKYVNKIVHRQIMSHPTFKFTAGPVTLEALEDLYLWDDERAASADYRAATNLIYREICEWANLCLSSRLGWSYEYHEWSTKLLTNVTLSMTLENGVQKVAEQKRGQLMGCPLSFPILCIINAAVGRVMCYINDSGRLPPRRRSLEAVLTAGGPPRLTRSDGCYVIRKRLRQCRLQVNGDDNIFALKPSLYPIFKQICDAAGFELSVGKSYFSREFGMINSKLFVYGFDGAVWKPVQLIPYLNMGLLKGTGRVLCDERQDGLDEVDFFSDCGTKCHKLIEGYDAEDQSVLFSMFVKWNSAKLKRTSRDWYLSRTLGGLELPLLAGNRPALSTHAALVASYAQSVGGVSLDKPQVTNVASTLYRRSIPHILVDRSEIPEDYDARDDTVVFWRCGLLVRDVSPNQAENRFWRLHREAIKQKVAPMKERTARRWVSVPTVNFNIEPLPLPFVRV